MNTSVFYILVAIVALLVVVLLVLFTRLKGQRKSLTPLVGLAFGFILAGIFFGDDRVIGYGLMGVGVLLAVVDILLKSRSSP